MSDEAMYDALVSLQEWMKLDHRMGPTAQEMRAVTVLIRRFRAKLTA